MTSSSPEQGEQPYFVYRDNEFENCDLERAVGEVGYYTNVAVLLGQVSTQSEQDWEETIAHRIDGFCAMAGVEKRLKYMPTGVLVDSFSSDRGCFDRGQYGRLWTDQTIGELVTSVAGRIDEYESPQLFANGGGYVHSFYLPSGNKYHMMEIMAQVFLDDNQERLAHFSAAYGAVVMNEGTRQLN